MSLSQVFVNVRELAQYLKVSPASVYRLVERRLIPFHRLPRGLRFSAKDVEEYLMKCRVESFEHEYERKKNS